MTWWQNFYHSAINQLELFTITDIIDIAIVSYVVYKALKFIRDTENGTAYKRCCIGCCCDSDKLFRKAEYLVFYFKSLSPTRNYRLAYCLSAGNSACA